ncbi:MAG TPA: 3-oxoadipate enol-lactonase [Streptosporangiaceae bacterium]|nr:3-oxoadipate enol-lactonase [Streptosporangiaceae bacterium]
MTTLLHYEVTGDGPPLVLAGSIGSSLAMWEPQLPALAERFRVVRVDHRGHGRSPVPPGPYTIADLGADVLAVLDHLGERQASMCGLSLGGMVGMWLAAHAPERITALALLATSPHLGSVLWEQRIAAVEAGGMAAIVDGAMARWFTDDFRARHPDQVARYAAMLTATPAAGYVGCCAAIRDMDQRADVAKISAPTLVMVGTDDVATPPAHARDLTERIAGARLEEVPGAAHLLNVERPDTVNHHLLDHLERHAHG